MDSRSCGNKSISQVVCLIYGLVDEFDSVQSILETYLVCGWFAYSLLRSYCHKIWKPCSLRLQLTNNESEYYMSMQWLESIFFINLGSCPTNYCVVNVHVELVSVVGSQCMVFASSFLSLLPLSYWHGAGDHGYDWWRSRLLLRMCWFGITGAWSICLLPKGSYVSSIPLPSFSWGMKK